MKYDSRQDIFDFVYEMAMNDATRRTACAGSKNALLQHDRAKKEVQDYYGESISGKGTSRTNNERIIKKVASILKKVDNNFSFGNAQKLVNMVAKYYYITVSSDDSMKNRFADFDCPMDRYMKSYVVSEYKRAIRNDDAQKRKRVEYYSNGTTETRDWSLIAWSKLTDKDVTIYSKYQDMAKYLSAIEHISPLEYDYKHWREAVNRMNNTNIN